MSPAVTRPYFFLAVFFAAFFAAFFAIRILPPLHLGFWVRATTATTLATALRARRVRPVLSTD
jgi:hypothetical protein